MWLFRRFGRFFFILSLALVIAHRDLFHRAVYLQSFRPEEKNQRNQNKNVLYITFVIPLIYNLFDRSISRIRAKYSGNVLLLFKKNCHQCDDNNKKNFKTKMRFNFYEFLLLYKSNGLRIHVLFLYFLTKSIGALVAIAAAISFVHKNRHKRMPEVN